ncbi:hypothetical protein BLOT_006627 [Blomia tropicalis]|nr:hypothetical protein BLOT_006627 [Blomia tropicalis]
MKFKISYLWSYKRYFIAWFTPLIWSPLLFVQDDGQESKCAYVVLLMVTYWFTEVIPMSITSLIPMVMFPILGIVNSNVVAKSYYNGTIMVFLGSLIAATAVEKSNLHERIALKVILLSGTSPKRLLAGFMFTASFLSMWISNLASVALMIPIVNAALDQLTRRKSVSYGTCTTDPGVFITMDEKLKLLAIQRKHPERILLGICYAANIGGTGTLTGSSTNLVLNAIYKERPISFSHWFFFNVPGLVIAIILTWLFLIIFFVKTKSKQNSKQNEEQVYETIKIQYEQLGSLRFHEIAVLILFLLMLSLWFFRAPDFMKGWASFLQNPNYINDAVPAIFVVLLFFVIPADPMHLKSSAMLLDWKTTQERVSWGIILLLGGGFAMALGCEESGLSLWIGNKLANLSTLPQPLITIIMCAITLVMTEMTSNTATCTILLPVIKQMATTMGVNPMSIMLPVTVSCSYAFMLPVSSGTNAIIFEAGRMKMKDMLLPGFFVKILCLTVLLIMNNTWGEVIFHISRPVVTNDTFIAKF